MTISAAATIPTPPMAARPQRGTLPGFRLALGFTVVPLVLIVLVPLAGLAIKTATLSPGELVAAVFTSRALAAYKLTFGASAVAGLVNMVFGMILAWVLARYRFPGRGLIDALIDLPFALPTAVAGIALTALYAENGWLGRYLEPHGINGCCGAGRSRRPSCRRPRNNASTPAATPASRRRA